jgi:hypothetical protein
VRVRRQIALFVEGPSRSHLVVVVLLLLLLRAFLFVSRRIACVKMIFLGLEGVLLEREQKEVLVMVRDCMFVARE